MPGSLSPPGAGAAPAKGLRRDAQARQEQILAAAVVAIVRQGRQVPMQTIADEAGVGVATLYRRYPSRDALLDALSERAFALLADTAAEARARPGAALDQLSWWWAQVVEFADQLVLPLHGGPADLGELALAERARLHGHLGGLLQLGHSEGCIRRDVGVRDVIMFGALLVKPLTGVPDWPATARRLIEVHVRGVATAR